MPVLNRQAAGRNCEAWWRQRYDFRITEAHRLKIDRYDRRGSLVQADRRTLDRSHRWICALDNDGRIDSGPQTQNGRQHWVASGIRVENCDIQVDVRRTRK